jgi:hypothetical protein
MIDTICTGTRLLLAVTSLIAIASTAFTHITENGFSI